MIKFGKKRVKLSSQITQTREVVRGYYLVLPNGDRIWFGETLHAAAKNFGNVCDKYLDDSGDFWIDYCSGYDVDNNLAWTNIDQSDRLYDYGAKQ